MFAFIIVCGSYEGHVAYDTEYQVQDAADYMTALTGQKWEVRWVYFPEEF